MEVTSSFKQINTVMKTFWNNLTNYTIANVIYGLCSLYTITRKLNVSFYHIIVSNQDATGKLIYDIDFKTTIYTTKKLIYRERYESLDNYFQIILSM